MAKWVTPAWDPKNSGGLGPRDPEIRPWLWWLACRTVLLLQVFTKNYDVTEAYIAKQIMFLDFYVAALCHLGFTICGSYMEQV